MKIRFRTHIFDAGQGNLFLRNAREARPHEELPDDAASIRELVTKLARQLGATAVSSSRRRWQAHSPNDEELKRLGDALLSALKDRKRPSIAAACNQIAQWAEGRNALRTAAVFAEAAARFDGNDPVLANRAGKLAMRRAEYEAAKRWYQRGIDVGARQQNWDAVAIGWSGLGAIARSSGEDLDDAISYHMRSLALARRYGLSAREGEGFHALAVLAFDRQRYHEGITYARKALDTYGKDRPQVVILANDLAWFWMDKHQAYGRALPIFRETVRLAHTPAHQIVMLGNLARAAGGMGDWVSFESAEYRLQATLPEAQDREGHAAALLELAKGALLLGLEENARRYAQEALAAAEARKEKALRAEAKAFIEHLEMPQPTPAEDNPRVKSKPVEQRMDDLATELVLALR